MRAPSLEAMIDDVEALRPSVDVLLVVFHKGIGHTPARVADYERQVAHAAIRRRRRTSSRGTTRTACAAWKSIAANRFITVSAIS